MSMETEGANIGSIRARFNMNGNSAGSPTTVTAHFGCDGSTLSGAEMELISPGYRTSLVKRRFVAGTLLPLVLGVGVQGQSIVTLFMFAQCIV